MRFWSITVYDGKSQLLVKNPINRYLISSPMLPAMKKDADGSLTLYIQKDSPGADKEANWLPAPDDTIYLVMRLYWPKHHRRSCRPAQEHGSHPVSSGFDGTLTDNAARKVTRALVIQNRQGV